MNLLKPLFGALPFFAQILGGAAHYISNQDQSNRVTKSDNNNFTNKLTFWTSYNSSSEYVTNG